MGLVEFDQVGLEVAGRNLMKDVDFSMEPGEHIGIIGPSGAGKTTFINLMLGPVSYTHLTLPTNSLV